MNIANTITYGGFFNLPGADLYTIMVSVRRAGSQQSFSNSNTLTAVGNNDVYFKLP